eukprot:GHUV01036113.1.p1 GENE.GHUV01036113.1~~GHUV01036113.1.p1  ORF type:complete len:104 (-),score=21.42 GHUV01036113.1:259-570(-)
MCPLGNPRLWLMANRLCYLCPAHKLSMCTPSQDFVDQHLISTGEQPAIKPVMGGTFVQQIICRGVEYTSERVEEFYQISVDVKGMGCLEKSLDDYVKVCKYGA